MLCFIPIGKIRAGLTAPWVEEFKDTFGHFPKLKATKYAALPTRNPVTKRYQMPSYEKDDVFVVTGLEPGKRKQNVSGKNIVAKCIHKTEPAASVKLKGKVGDVLVLEPQNLEKCGLGFWVDQGDEAAFFLGANFISSPQAVAFGKPKTKKAGLPDGHIPQETLETMSLADILAYRKREAQWPI